MKDFIEAGMKKAGGLNKLSGVIRTATANLIRCTQGGGHLGDEVVLRLADYLGEPREKLLLLNQAEKAPEVSRSAWENVIKRLTFAALGGVLISMVSGGLAEARVATGYILPDVLRLVSRALNLLRPRGIFPECSAS